MTIAPLYRLADQYQHLLDQLQAAETDEERDALLAVAPNLNEEIEQKVEGCCMVVAQLSHSARVRKAEADSMMAEANRLAALAKADEARAKWLEGYMLRSLQSMETDHVETPRFRVSVMKNPAAVELYDEKSVPGTYLIRNETWSVDRVSIRKAIQGGLDVPGARLVQGSHLKVT